MRGAYAVGAPSSRPPHHPVRLPAMARQVQLMPFELYEGASTKAELLPFMEAHGFALVGEQAQCYGQEANLTFERRRVGVDLHRDGARTVPV